MKKVLVVKKGLFVAVVGGMLLNFSPSQAADPVIISVPMSLSAKMLLFSTMAATAAAITFVENRDAKVNPYADLTVQEIKNMKTKDFFACLMEYTLGHAGKRGSLRVDDSGKVMCGTDVAPWGLFGTAWGLGIKPFLKTLKSLKDMHDAANFYWQSKFFDYQICRCHN